EVVDDRPYNWLHLIRGGVDLGGADLATGDAASFDHAGFRVGAKKDSEFLLFRLG
ncbi:MAG: pirin family protein, partial [Akkermansiaceae bacterium]|nr:pirin family protein [Akkermansiaceae bacterium]